MLFVKKTNVNLVTVNFATQMVIHASNVMTNILSFQHLIKHVFLMCVLWKIVRNVRLIRRNVRNVIRIQLVIFPQEVVLNLKLRIVLLLHNLKKVLNVGIVKVGSKSIILHGRNVIEYAKIPAVLTVKTVH